MRHSILYVFFALQIQVLTSAHADDLTLAAYYDDGNDKQAVVDLRKRDPATLTTEERAVTMAASKTGVIQFCKGKSSNAFLVRIDGRDAVITSGHAAIDEETGRPKCDLTDAGYYPNGSFYDILKGPPTEWENKIVYFDGQQPLNLENLLAGQNAVNGVTDELDFLIFFLNSGVESPSKDILPDGTVRGYFKVAKDLGDDMSEQKNVNTYLIGTDPNFDDGWTTTFQSCSRHNSWGSNYFYHACDTMKGTSSSFIGEMNGEELYFVAMHTTGNQETTRLPERYLDWNIGITTFPIIEFLASQGMTFD